MGCTESVPVANAFEMTHKVGPEIPHIGAQQGAVPSTYKTQLIVREKLFSWSGDSFSIKTASGQNYQNLRIKGKAIAFRDRMVLEDALTRRPVAVCLRKFEFVGQTFKIYTTQPLYSGQSPSQQRYQNYKLYTYAKVERVPFSTEQQVILDDESTPSFTIQRAGSWWPKKRVVKRHGMPAALMEGGTWEGNWNSYLITINPGIDPCLIVCLAAICDEMDEDR